MRQDVKDLRFTKYSKELELEFGARKPASGSTANSQLDPFDMVLQDLCSVLIMALKLVGRKSAHLGWRVSWKVLLAPKVVADNHECFLVAAAG